LLLLHTGCLAAPAACHLLLLPWRPPVLHIGCCLLFSIAACCTLNCTSFNVVVRLIAAAVVLAAADAGSATALFLLLAAGACCLLCACCSLALAWPAAALGRSSACSPARRWHRQLAVAASLLRQTCWRREHSKQQAGRGQAIGRGTMQA
jgi:hypothetical protein